MGMALATAMMADYENLTVFRAAPSQVDDTGVPNLLIGPMSSRRRLVELNVQFVVSVVTPYERLFPDYPKQLPLNVQEQCVDLDDSSDASLPWDLLESILKQIHDRLKNGRVLVHCHAGLNRSALVVCAYMVASGHAATAEQAMEKLTERRPGVLSNLVFRAMLCYWESALKKMLLRED